MLICLLRTQPDRSRLLRANHEVDIVLRTETVGDGTEETVRVGRKVDAGDGGLEVEDCADERGILMTEAVI